MTGFVCSYPRYEYEGWVFEVPPFGSPWPLTKRGFPYKRGPARVFWRIIERFEGLSKEEREKHHLGGGCQSI